MKLFAAAKGIGTAMRVHAALIFTALASVSAGQPAPSQGAADPIPATRRAGLTIKVPNFEQARGQLVQIVRDRSGTIVEARDDVTEKGRRHGRLAFRIPRADLDRALVEIRGLGKVAFEASSVTENQKDVDFLEARIELLQVHHRRLGSLLAGRASIRARDILYVQDRLFNVETDLEGLRLQRSAIVRSSQTAGVSVHLYEPYLPGEKNPLPKGPAERFREAFKEAVKDTLASLAGLSGTLLKLLVWSPIWVPLALLARKWWKRAFPAEAEKAASTPPDGAT